MAKQQQQKNGPNLVKFAAHLGTVSQTIATCVFYPKYVLLNLLPGCGWAPRRGEEEATSDGREWVGVFGLALLVLG